MAVGFDSMVSGDDELECLLDNLRFVYTTARGFDETRYEYYKEKLLKQYSDEDLNDYEVVAEVEPTVHEEQPTTTMVGGPKDTPWPMQSHDTHHTGRSPYSTANTTSLEKWRFYFRDWLEDTPVIDSDGTIYAGTGWELYAINPNGTLKWMYQADGLIWCSSPAIAEDGTIYVGSWDFWGNLYAINPDGTLKWTFPSGADISSSPAIADDGTIYFGNMIPGFRIYAVNPNGTEKWRYQTGDVITSDPAIGDDGTVYIGSCDNYLYALWPNGTLRWRFPTGYEIHGDPAIAEDGTVIIGSYDNYLYALNPNGTLKWKRSGLGTGNSVAIDEDGIIYVATDNIYALYPNGTTKWTFYPNGAVFRSSPSISSDGTIYVGTGDGQYIIAIDSNNGTQKWFKHISQKWVESSPSIAEDGAVYIGSTFDMSRGYLCAFGTVESNSPPEPPIINGPTRVRVGEEYWFRIGAIDPDNNPIRLFIDWGDGNSDWFWEFASGEKHYFEHIWSEQGNYTIKAKAKDVFDEESGWGYLEVTVPKNKMLHNPLLLRLLERFPMLERLLFFLF